AQLQELVLQHPLRADLHRDGDARAGGHVGQVAPLQRAHEAQSERTRGARAEHDGGEEAVILRPRRRGGDHLQEGQRHRAPEEGDEQDVVVAAALQHLLHRRGTGSRAQEVRKGAVDLSFRGRRGDHSPKYARIRPRMSFLSSPAPGVRSGAVRSSWACVSASRRSERSVEMSTAMVGLAARISWKAGLSIMKRSTSVAASMVAERRSPVSSAISPKNCPSMRRAISRSAPPMRFDTSTCPWSMMKKLSPGLPSSITRSPAA